jgi:hypothetical protein
MIDEIKARAKIPAPTMGIDSNHQRLWMLCAEEDRSYLLSEVERLEAARDAMIEDIFDISAYPCDSCKFNKLSEKKEPCKSCDKKETNTGNWEWRGGQKATEE